MKRLLAAAVGVLAVVSSIVLLAQAPAPARTAGDPATAVFWSAAQMNEMNTRAASRVDPATNMAGDRLLASATAIYRTGPSQAEVHEKLADFIFLREGEGVILVGGKMVGGKPSAADELRGDSIEGGTRYAVAAGDSIYIPANTPHQFFVEKGKHWAITIVKITPKP